MAQPAPIPANLHQAGDFPGDIGPDDMVYFLCNVGDGDAHKLVAIKRIHAQLVLLPADDQGERRAIVVDAGRTGKIPDLIDELVNANLLPASPAPVGAAPQPDDTIPLVVATHPHADHIRGMAHLLQTNGHRVSELWDSGYWHTIGAYHNMMGEIEQLPYLRYSQPTSGYRKWIGNACVTVLSPSIHLRNRFDTYGTKINDASISVRIETPATRVIQRNDQRELVNAPNTVSVVLGADAQTLSWSYVLTDFPYLPSSGSAAAQAIRAATGRDLLRGDVFKVSHHASKHGVNLELVERIHPYYTLISSVASGGMYNFPHTVAQEVIREALEARASSGNPHSPDWDLHIFHTSDVDDDAAGTRLGSMGAILRPGRRRLWRFGDDRGDPIQFAGARRWVG